jgi:hypothetical protein
MLFQTNCAATVETENKASSDSSEFDTCVDRIQSSQPENAKMRLYSVCFCCRLTQRGILMEGNDHRVDFIDFSLQPAFIVHRIEIRM